MTTLRCELREAAPPEAGADGREVRRAQVHVPADLVYFRGHFDDYPVLPAVAQVTEILLPLVARAWPDLGALHRMQRAKWRRPVPPGADLAVELARIPGTRRVTYRIEHEGEVSASGQLELR